jgi:ketosteroid isomerase-like protein
VTGEKNLERNKDTARRFLVALTGGDVATLKELCTEDLVAITPGTAGVSGVRDYDVVMASAAIFPTITKAGLTVSFLNVTAEDDRVACEVEGSSVLLDGRDYNNCYHFLVFLRDGKVCKLKEYTDTKLADAVLGPYLPAHAPLDAG